MRLTLVVTLCLVNYVVLNVSFNGAQSLVLVIDMSVFGERPVLVRETEG